MKIASSVAVLVLSVVGGLSLLASPQRRIGVDRGGFDAAEPTGAGSVVR